MSGFEQYFYSPTGDGKSIYLVSHQCLFVYEEGKLNRLCSFRHNLKDLKISSEGILSFFSREHSNGDIYTYEPRTNKIKRITYFDDPRIINVGWDGKKVIFASSTRTSFNQEYMLYSADQDGLVEKLLRQMSYWAKGQNGTEIVQRYGYAYHKWRDYQGGSAARLLVKTKEGWEGLKLPLNNCYNPVFMGNRLFFLSDCVADEGKATNVFEYILDEEKWEQRTFHKDFCVFDLSVFGSNKLIYSCGGMIYTFDLELNKSEKVDIIGTDYSESEAVFYSGLADFYTNIDVNDKGDRVAIGSRGRVFSYDVMQQVTVEHTQDLRYRLFCFLPDNSMIYVRDEGDSCTIKHKCFDKDDCYSDISLNLGRIKEIMSFGATKVLIVNHKGELYIVDMQNGSHEFVAKSKVNHFGGIDYSPDLRWIVFSSVVSQVEPIFRIMLYKVQTKETYQVSNSLEDDVCPKFTKDGKYIYFVSTRQNMPKYDTKFFNLYFNSKADVYAICVNAEVEHPFKPSEQKQEKTEEGAAIVYPDIIINEIKIVKSKIPSDYLIDMIPLAGKKTLLLSRNENGNRKRGFQVKCHDGNSGEMTTICGNVSMFALSNNAQHMVLLIGNRIRLGAAGEKLNDEDKSWKNGGWCSTERFEYPVNPRIEWVDIVKESWWLIKERFWNPELLGDWKGILDKYLELVERIQSREDLNLVLEQLNGELKSSHAYLVNRGDNSIVNHCPIGYLGADVVWNADGYEITNIHKYYNAEDIIVSPLLQQGIYVAKGDKIVAVNGVKCSWNLPLEYHFQYKNNGKVMLTIMSGSKTRNVTVDLLPNLKSVKYFTWVRETREYVHKMTGNRVGYIHIPDMVATGFREFYKAYTVESRKEALIIDARWNCGGHVSYHLLNMLRNKSLGFVKSKQEIKDPIPDNSNSGVMVCLMNQDSGSDGDIFSHEFKTYKLGKTIGTRTWGGVIGIMPDSSEFVDKGQTNQPEYATIYYDMQGDRDLENYGVEPEIVVENPVNWATCKEDAQLNRGIKELMDELG